MIFESLQYAGPIPRARHFLIPETLIRKKAAASFSSFSESCFSIPVVLQSQHRVIGATVFGQGSEG
jgi:hypothetical protein